MDTSQHNDISLQLKKHSVRMNDNPELFHKTNKVTRRDAMDSLDEFASKFKWKKKNVRVIDIGSAEGSVTSILLDYIPKNYEVLLGCDINENSVNFANILYGTDRVKFMALDIEAQLPDNLRENFDHAFSFSTLHWLSDIEKGYRNIYNLLKAEGECFLTVAGKTPFYDIFLALSRTNKWASWVKNYETFVSPYHDCKDPDNIIYETLKNIGFHSIEMKCKQKVYVYENTEVLKKGFTNEVTSNEHQLVRYMIAIHFFLATISSLNPFNMPKDLHDQFMEDYVEVARDMRFVEPDGTVKFSYNMILIHCIK